MKTSGLASMKSLIFTTLAAVVAEAQLTSTVVNPSASAASTPASFRPLYTPPASVDEGQPLLANVVDPEAVNAQSVCPGYRAGQVTRTSSGLSAILTLAGTACNIYGTDVESLNLTVEYQSADRLHVGIVPTFVDSSIYTHFILGEDRIRNPGLDDEATTAALDNDLSFVWSNEPTFSFSIIRQSTGDALFTTQGTKLIIENQFIEFVTELPEHYNLYGLGEVIHGLRLGNNLTRTIYATDAGDPIDGNIYGSHPFYLETRYYRIDPQTGEMTLVTGDATTDTADRYISRSHGVYLRNAHGQEILLNERNVTWRTIGGSIDLYFYAGPSQPEVTKSYLRSSGGFPAMQQYFTLGFHQCRWGYANWSQTEEIVNTFERFGIPLESIWLDIDYMNQYRDFDNDLNTFPYDEGQQFLRRLHDSGRHFIPIVDAAIYAPNPENASDAAYSKSSYGTYTRGNDQGVFLQNPDGSQYLGIVWPGITVFPDWSAEAATPWWINELQTWYDLVPYDGMWIDMSEVSSFCVGSCGTGNLTMNPIHPPFVLPGQPTNEVYDYPEGFNVTNATEASSAAALSSSQAAATASAASSTMPDYRRTTPTPGIRDINYPPYVMNHLNLDLAVHAVSPNATHADGTVEYDFHNLYGHNILNATYQALLNVFPGKRPFIIGRSTFVGSGIWAGHWGGDNFSQWRYMFFSIPQALTFSLFGIPMFGADTCGFNGNSAEELCNRWMQLSAFFPFYRNHNVLSAIPQEPYVWASVIDASKRAMNIRYQLLPYMYTLFHQAHNTGSTVMRALAWEFPNEPILAAADRQFLLGPSILVTPVLTPQATTVDGVFPGVAEGTVWYDWYTQRAVNATAGKNNTIDAPLGHIPVYVRGGSVLPLQGPALTTRDARRNPWSLLVALGRRGEASGMLYIDDGESLVPEATLEVKFTAQQRHLYANARGLFVDSNPLANVTVMGISSPVSEVLLNGQALASGWTYDDNSQLLSISNLRDVTSQGAWTSDWTLSWA
ncbi:MAG: hypothetical protein M1817_000377 [Caeruleum heppii]|nr:MAG: hypothetical protein M1817_000377 [Caeruleum heppii]